VTVQRVARGREWSKASIPYPPPSMLSSRCFLKATAPIQLCPENGVPRKAPCSETRKSQQSQSRRHGVSPGKLATTLPTDSAKREGTMYSCAISATSIQLSYTSKFEAQPALQPGRQGLSRVFTTPKLKQTSMSSIRRSAPVSPNASLADVHSQNHKT